MGFSIGDGTASVDFKTLEETSADELASATLHSINVAVDDVQTFSRRGVVFSLVGDLLAPFEATRTQFRTWFRNETDVTLTNDEFTSGIKVKILNYAFTKPLGIVGILRCRLLLREVK